MRIAIFSDVHGNLTALEAVLADIGQQGVDELVFGGDLCLFGARPAESLALIRGQKIPAVYGNTEIWLESPPPLLADLPPAEQSRRQLLQAIAAWTRHQLSDSDRAWLADLPFSRRISPTADPAGDLLITHANPRDVYGVIFPPPAAQQGLYGQVRQSDDDLNGLLGQTTAAVIAFGHIHIPFVRHWRGLRLVNISSVSLPGDGNPAAKYAILTWQAGQWLVEHRQVAYDVRPEIAAFESQQPPNWQNNVASLLADGFIAQKV